MASNNGTIKVQFQKKGDWKRIGLLTNTFRNKSYEPWMSWAARYMAEEYLRRLQMWIKNPDPRIPLIELAPSTIAKKVASGSQHAEQPWVDTEFLLKHLKITTEKEGNKVRFFVGATDDQIHDPSGLKMTDLLRWLEYGTKKMPARPLMRLTYLSLEKEFDTIMKKGQNNFTQRMMF